MFKFGDNDKNIKSYKLFGTISHVLKANNSVHVNGTVKFYVLNDAKAEFWKTMNG